MRQSGVAITLLAIVGSVLIFIAPVSAAEIVGKVVNVHGLPVAGLKISVINKATRTLVADSVTGPEGSFSTSSLPDGDYLLRLNTAKTPYRGQTVEAYLDSSGLTVDWVVSSKTAAVATASRGVDPKQQAIAGDPFGMTHDQFVLTVAGGLTLIGAGVIGGVAAAGGFDGSSCESSSASPCVAKKPSSPTM